MHPDSQALDGWRMLPDGAEEDLEIQGGQLLLSGSVT